MAQDRGRRRALAGELIVPAVMVLFLLAYWWQAVGISGVARAFPAALSVALVVLLAMQMVALWRLHRSRDEDARGGVATPPAPRPRGTARQRAALVGLAVILLAFWQVLGGTIVIFAFMAGALLILGERRPLMLALLPILLAVGLSYLFQSVLRVRFPAGPLGLF